MAATGSIIPASLDLAAVIGEDWSRTIKLYTDLAQTSAFDLTGYTVTMVIGTSSVPQTFTLTSGSGLAITVGTGTIVASLTHTQTATVGDGGPHNTQPCSLAYYLKLVDGGGLVTFPLSGSVVFQTP